MYNTCCCGRSVQARRGEDLGSQRERRSEALYYLNTTESSQANILLLRFKIAPANSMVCFSDCMRVISFETLNHGCFRLVLRPVGFASRPLEYCTASTISAAAQSA